MSDPAEEDVQQAAGRQTEGVGAKEEGKEEEDAAKEDEEEEEETHKSQESREDPEEGGHTKGSAADEVSPSSPSTPVVPSNRLSSLLIQGTGDARAVPELQARVSAYLGLAALLYVSSTDTAARRAASPVVRLVVAVSKLALACSTGQPGTLPLSGLVELVSAERHELIHQIPLVVTLLGNIIHCPQACRATRHCAIESLGQVLGSTHRLSECFALFDCDSRRPDVCLDVLKILEWSSTQKSCRRRSLDVLLGVSRSITAGLRASALGGAGPEANAAAEKGKGPWASLWARREEELAAQKSFHRTFNRAPEEWWNTFRRSTTDDALEKAARQLYHHGKSLDRNALGSLLCTHKELLEAYLGLHDFERLDLVPAFRLVLRNMSPPGEAQQIDRFCECLGAAWGRANGLAADVAYIFAFSLVMLSTDQHAATRSNIERMTYTDFARNLEGALPKGALPEKMMKTAYEQVREGALLDARNPKLDADHDSVAKACTRFFLSLRLQLATPPSSTSSSSSSSSSPPAQTEQPISLHPLDFVESEASDLWRCLWGAAWPSMLGAFSAAAHAAGENEQLLELALRGLQLGCEASTLVGEASQAEAFFTALQQLSLGQETG